MTCHLLFLSDFFPLHLLEQICTKCKDYCLESKMTVSLRTRREEQKEMYGEAIFSLTYLDEMALNSVYDCRISTAPQDRKCSPSYLTYHMDQGI